MNYAKQNDIIYIYSKNIVNVSFALKKSRYNLDFFVSNRKYLNKMIDIATRCYLINIESQKEKIRRYKNDFSKRIVSILQGKHR